MNDSSDLLLKKLELKKNLRVKLDTFLQNKYTIGFQSGQKKVSVVIVLWNQAELTLACLESLFSSSFNNYEVIIVNNGSTDRTNALLKRVSGIRTISNLDNIGFLKAVNQAVKVASGELLLLLNNDTIIEPNALLNAVNRITSEDSIGAVGGKIILPNGMLQEAGCIIWNDGSCSGYLRNCDPNCNEAMFERDVDYCSAAFLLTRLRLFKQLGCFDEAYAPAYYEETDYCVRLRQNNYRVVYSPTVSVKHYEFGSTPKVDIAFRQMETNKDIFYSKFRNTLITRYKNDHKNILYARNYCQFKKILIISDTIPILQLGVEDSKTTSIINTLASNDYLVTIFPIRDYQISSDEVYKHISRRVEVILNKGIPLFHRFIKSRLNYYDTILILNTPIHSIKNILLYFKYIEQVKIFYDTMSLSELRRITDNELKPNKKSGTTYIIRNKHFRYICKLLFFLISMVRI